MTRGPDDKEFEASSTVVEMQGWGEVKEGFGAPIRKLLKSRHARSTLVQMADGKEVIVHTVAWGRDAGDMWEHVICQGPPVELGEKTEWHFFVLSEVACIIDPETGITLLAQTPCPGER
ncbi:hypothetical protein G6L46_06215 [Agrobacterium rhizogenes]|uniref:hypothetical protein n=1 Tax=Rhizobium rhizogenes TaxID=359 RepID=UPI001573A766|nr:hypothetical protein [Rhizobium rhizogenes]NTF86727.1 hypothetical protein [Rhizobium rhizogenes]